MFTFIQQIVWAIGFFFVQFSVEENGFLFVGNFFLLLGNEGSYASVNGLTFSPSKQYSLQFNQAVFYSQTPTPQINVHHELRYANGPQSAIQNNCSVRPSNQDWHFIEHFGKIRLKAKLWGCFLRMFYLKQFTATHISY